MGPMDSIIEVTDLLNDLNGAIASKPRTLDCVVTASSVLLAAALRQIGGAHGWERARHISRTLNQMVRVSGMSEDQVFEAFMGIKR